MTHKTLKTLFMATMLAASATVAAEESRFSFGPTLGSAGLGLEFGFALTDTLSARAAYNFFEFDTDYEDTDVRYDGTLDKSSVSLLLDWNPGNGGFRVTGGAFRHNRNAFNAVATPAREGTYTFDGNEYDASEIGTIHGAASFRKTAPYLGIGWGNLSHSRGFTFTVDLGVQFQNAPRVSLLADDCSFAPAECAQINSDLQAEARQLEQEGKDLEYWPVLAIGLVYRF